MNLDPNPVRQWLQTAVRGRLRGAAAFVPEAGRWPLDPTDESTEVAWAELRRLGAPALDAPLEADGLALGLAASSAVAEELGWAALAGRYLAVALAVDAATSAGNASETLVRSLVGGEVAVTLAGFERAGEVVRAAAGDSGDLRLTGHLPVDLPSGELAGTALVPVGLDGDQIGLVLLDLSTVDITTEWEPSGAGGLAVLAGTRCADAAVLCRWPGSTQCPDGVLGRARVRQAAYLLGLARGALATGVRHATDRRQFDRPLRDFQSVSFRLAAGYVQVEALRLAVARAVWLADGEQRFGRQAAEVLAQAAETASEIVQLVMQVCGARGLTGELSAHRYYLRIRREAGRLGQPGALWREAGRDRLREHAGAGSWPRS